MDGPEPGDETSESDAAASDASTAGPGTESTTPAVGAGVAMSVLKESVPWTLGAAALRSLAVESATG